MTCRSQPLFVRGVHDGLVAAGPRIVDEDVGPIEGALGSADQRAGALESRDVARDPDGPDAVLARDARGFGLDACRIAGAEQEVHPLGREPLGDSEADADAAARNDGDLARELQVHV